METINFELVKNHIVFQDGEDCALLDTGSPITLDFREDVSEIADSIQQNVCTGLMKLIGMDKVKEYAQVLFDYHKCKVILARDGEEINIENEFARYACDYTLLPVFLMKIGNHEHKMILDTGAVLGYLKARIAERSDVCVGQKQDFLPLLGSINQSFYTHQVQLGEDVFNIDLGAAHLQTEVEVSMLGADGVIGYDLFSRFQILMDMRRGELVFGRFA